MSKKRKLYIISLETSNKICATYDPKEISFDKDAGWSEDSDGIGSDTTTMQFTNGKSINLSLELFFDRYEEADGDVRKDINELLQMTMVMDKDEGAKRRPPMVQVVWADPTLLNGQDPFTGVIKSVSTKYTMFHENGVPCRATASVSLTEATTVEARAKSGSGDDAKDGGYMTTFERPSTIPNSEEMKKLMDEDEDFDPADPKYFPHITYSKDFLSDEDRKK